MLQMQWQAVKPGEKENKIMNVNFQFKEPHWQRIQREILGWTFNEICQHEKVERLGVDG